MRAPNEIKTAYSKITETDIDSFIDKLNDLIPFESISLNQKDLLISSVIPEKIRAIFNERHITNFEYNEKKYRINKNSFVYLEEMPYSRVLYYIINLGYTDSRYYSNSRYYSVDLKDNFSVIHFRSLDFSDYFNSDEIIKYKKIYTEGNNLEKIITEKLDKREARKKEKLKNNLFSPIFDKIIEKNDLESFKQYISCLLKDKGGVRKEQIAQFIMAFKANFDRLKANDEMILHFIDFYKKIIEKNYIEDSTQSFFPIFKIISIHSIITGNLRILEKLIETVEESSNEMENILSKYIVELIQEITSSIGLEKINVSILRSLILQEWLNPLTQRLSYTPDEKNKAQIDLIMAHKTFFDGLKEKNPFNFTSTLLKAISYDIVYTLQAIGNHLIQRHNIGSNNPSNSEISSDITLNFFVPALAAIFEIAKIIPQDQYETNKAIVSLVGDIIVLDCDQQISEKIFKNDQEKMDFLRKNCSNIIPALGTMTNKNRSIKHEAESQDYSMTDNIEISENDIDLDIIIEDLDTLIKDLEISLSNEERECYFNFNQFIAYIQSKEKLILDHRVVNILLSILPVISDSQKAISHYWLHKIFNETGQYQDAFHHCMMSIFYNTNPDQFQQFLSERKETAVLYEILKNKNDSMITNIAKKHSNINFDFNVRWFFDFIIKQYHKEFPQLLIFLQALADHLPDACKDTDIFKFIFINTPMISSQQQSFDFEKLCFKLIEGLHTVNNTDDQKANLEHQCLLIDELLLEIKNKVSTETEKNAVKSLRHFMIQHKLVLQFFIRHSQANFSLEDIKTIFSNSPSQNSEQNAIRKDVQSVFFNTDNNNYQTIITKNIDKFFEKTFCIKNTKTPFQFFSPLDQTQDPTNHAPALTRQSETNTL